MYMYYGQSWRTGTYIPSAATINIFIQLYLYHLHNFYYEQILNRVVTIIAVAWIVSKLKYVSMQVCIR